MSLLLWIVLILILLAVFGGIFAHPLFLLILVIALAVYLVDRRGTRL